jgi:hypothetical protein
MERSHIVLVRDYITGLASYLSIAHSPGDDVSDGFPPISLRRFCVIWRGKGVRWLTDETMVPGLFGRQKVCERIPLVFNRDLSI